MRYASNTFVEMQKEIIRPPFKNIYLYVGADNCYPHNAPGGNLNDLGFDTTVAPVVAPTYCRDVRAYAVLGQSWGVDSTWRICAPEKVNGSFSKPNHIVPYGVSVYAEANEEVIIGNPTYALNFTNIKSRLSIVFTGGHYPTKLEVEWYDTESGTWKSSGVFISPNPSGSSSWWFKYNNYGIPDKRFTRFKISSNTAGRFQLSYIMDQWSDSSTSTSPTPSMSPKIDASRFSVSLNDISVCKFCLSNTNHAPPSNRTDKIEIKITSFSRNFFQCIFKNKGSPIPVSLFNLHLTTIAF